MDVQELLQDENLMNKMGDCKNLDDFFNLMIDSGYGDWTVNICFDFLKEIKDKHVADDLLESIAGGWNILDTQPGVFGDM